MPWQVIGEHIEEFFATPCSLSIYANVRRPISGERRLLVNNLDGRGWLDIGGAALYVLPCFGFVCTLGYDDPHSVFMRQPTGDWEKILDRRAASIYGGISWSTNADGEQFPFIYATEAGTGDLFRYDGPYRLRIRRGGRIVTVRRHSWTRIGGPGLKFVEAGQPRPGSPAPLFGLTPDQQGIWQFTGNPGDWIQIGGAAEDIVGGTYSALVAIDPSSGVPLVYTGRPMEWLPVALAVGEIQPYHAFPFGRLLVDMYGSWYYRTPGGQAFLKRSRGPGYDVTRWLDLETADEIAVSLGNLFSFGARVVSQFSFPSMSLFLPRFPDALEGQNYGVSMSVAGGVPPYDWSIPSYWIVPHGLFLDRGDATLPDHSAFDLGSATTYMNLVGTPDVVRHPPPIEPTAGPIRFQFPVTVIDYWGTTASATASIVWRIEPSGSTPAPTPSEGVIGFAMPSTPEEYAINFEPNNFGPGVPFTVSWAGQNYGGEAITGSVQDFVSVTGEVSETEEAYSNQRTVDAPFDVLLPGHSYPSSEPFNAGLLAGRYTVAVRLNSDPDIPDSVGFNVTSRTFNIEE